MLEGAFETLGEQNAKLFDRLTEEKIRLQFEIAQRRYFSISNRTGGKNERLDRRDRAVVDARYYARRPKIRRRPYHWGR